MGGGGTSKSTTGDKESRETTKMLREKVQRPLIAKVMPQWLALLNGKMSGSQVPIVQGSTSAIKKGTNTALTAIQSMLGKAGLTGTPFGNRIQAETQASGEQKAASVGPDLALDMWRMAPGMITGSSNTIVNASRGNSSSSTNDGGAGWGQAAGQAAGGIAQTAMLYNMMNKNTQPPASPSNLNITPNLLPSSPTTFIG